MMFLSPVYSRPIVVQNFRSSLLYFMSLTTCEPSLHLTCRTNYLHSCPGVIIFEVYDYVTKFYLKHLLD